MSDIVESGPRGSGWGGWVVGGLALVALVAGLFRAGAGGTPAAEPSGSATPPATVSFDPDVDPIPADPVLPSLPGTLFARRWTGPRDPLLLAYESRVLREPGDDVTPYQIGGIGSPVTRLLPVTGGTVVVDYSGEQDMPGESTAVSFVASGSKNVVHLGDAGGVVRAAEPSSVWLVDRMFGEPGTRPRMRRVDVRDGRVRQRVTLPPDTQPLAGVATGIVLRSMNYQPNSDDWIWSPRTGKVVRRLGGQAMDWTARQVVVRDVTVCLRSCTMVLDVVDGTQTRVDALDEMMSNPSLSPDGVWVAAFCATGDVGTMRMLVTNLTTGDTDVVTDTEIGWHVSTEFAWSRDSQRLYVSINSGETAGQVAAWDIGSRQIGILLDETVQALATE